MKRSVYLFGVGIIIYTFIVGISFSIQKKFILHPKKLKQEHVFSYPFSFEEVWLSNQNDSIHAVHAFSENKGNKLILYFHGNADNLDRWGHVSNDFLDLGYDVLMLDYRGFGKSTGTASEENMYLDAFALYEYALNTYTADSIVIYGRSIGTGVATELASHVEAAQLILETPFYSMEDVIQERFPLLWVPGELQFKFENAEKIEKLKIPVHIFHGTKDRVVPIESALKLKPILKSSDSFTIIEKGRHKNLGDYDSYHQVLGQIL